MLIFIHSLELSIYLLDVIGNIFLFQSFCVKNRFIVAQTPLPGTIQDFLSLIYHSDVSCVVSLDDGAYTRKVTVLTFLNFPEILNKKKQHKSIFKDRVLKHIGWSVT